MILMAAAAWLMLSFSSCIVCGFDSYTVLFKCPKKKISPPPPPGGRKFFWGHFLPPGVGEKFFLGPLKSTVYESNPHTIQELKDNISHAVAAIKITILHRVYLKMIRRAQLCIDAGGIHFQHLL
jgi:hypothetical protein